MTRKRLTLIFIAILSIGFLLASISPADAGPPIRIMPLGDSITQGSNSGVVPDNSSFYISYRKALRDSLVSAGYETDYVGSLASGEAVFTDAQNEGHSGWTADQVADYIYGWLHDNPADFILLHIGTNDLGYPNPDINATVDDVQRILDEIDRYEDNYGVAITVFLARIINTAAYGCSEGSNTHIFNNDVAAMALDRVTNPANAAYPDKIVMVDMECAANIVYSLDMYDNLHPKVSGYDKMAAKWDDALSAYLGAAKQGSITIAKTTQPSGATGFGFTGDLGDFILADDQDMTVSGLEARNYKITESLHLGWILQSVSCSGGDFTLNTDGVTIHLNPGQNITCTFTNSEPNELPSGSYLDNGSSSPLYFSFSGGSSIGTKFDATIDGLVLDNSTAGSFTSQVFDGGGVVKWKGIDWIGNVGELPNGAVTDKSVDMSDNVLLLHLNQNASDSSGLGHDGTLFGTGVSIGAANSGKFKGGYTADNTDDGGHIAVASSSDFDFATTETDGFSFFTWFAKNGVCGSPDNDNEVIASRSAPPTRQTRGGWGAVSTARENPNRLVFKFWAQQLETLVSTDTINDGLWHHGGWVYDPVAGQVRLYLDGELVDEASTTPDPFTSTNPLCIGAYGVGCDTYEFVGNLDEVAVFKRALSLEEVKGLYTRGVAGLDLRVRACDDAACNGENFIDIADESPQALSLTGRYFQYAFNLTSPDVAHSPELYTVTIHLPSADIDGDGVVDGYDLYLFMLSYGKSSGNPGFDARCEFFDGNGTVNATDLVTFAAAFGK